MAPAAVTGQRSLTAKRCLRAPVRAGRNHRVTSGRGQLDTERIAFLVCPGPDRLVRARPRSAEGPRTPHPGRSFLCERKRLKSPCDAPKGRIRPGVFSVHTPCLIHFNFLDWLLLAVAHVVQNQRNIRSERLRRFTNIISIEILGSRRVTSPCRGMRFQEDALVRPIDELRLLLHMVPWKSLSSD